MNSTDAYNLYRQRMEEKYNAGQPAIETPAPAPAAPAMVDLAGLTGAQILDLYLDKYLGDGKIYRWLGDGYLVITTPWVMESPDHISRLPENWETTLRARMPDQMTVDEFTDRMWDFTY